MERLEEARKRLEEARRVAVLTGAGISKPSGIPTFRDAEGLWKNFNPLDYATPEAYARDPEKVWAWYAWRIQKVREAKPNPAHYALVELERRILSRGKLPPRHPERGRPSRPRGKPEPGGAPRQPPQGPVRGLREAVSLAGGLRPAPFCPACGHRARPDVVWFGEFLPEGAWERAERAFAEADFALVVGTSAEVEPAASLGRIAFASGAYLVEVNPEPTPSPPWPTSPCGRGRWRGWRYSSLLPRKTRRKGTSLRPRSSPMRFFR